MHLSPREKTSFPITLLLALAVVTITNLLVIDKSMHWLDSYGYLSQANALLNGNISKYLQDNFFILNNSDPLGPIAYPWGTPIVLATVSLLFPENIIAYKISNLLALLIVIIFFYFKSKNELGSYWWVVILPLGLMPVIIRSVNLVYSDIHYLSSAVISLFLLNHFKDKIFEPNNRIYFWALSLGVISYIPILFRLNGIIIPACFLIFILIKQIFSKQRPQTRHLLTQISIFILSYCICWKLTSLALPGVGKLQTEREWPLKLENFLSGLSYYAGVLTDLFSRTQFVGTIQLITVLAITVYGMSRFIRKDFLFLAFVFLTFLFFLFLDMRAGERYLLSIIPFCWFYFIYGLSELLKRLTTAKHTKLTFKLSFSILSIFLIVAIIQGYFNEFFLNYTGRHGANDHNCHEVYSFINNNTKSDDLIFFKHPHVIYYYTKRLGFYRKELTDINQPDFLIFSNPIDIPLNIKLDLLEKVFSNKVFTVYRISKNIN